jgi:hypothetical protein
MQLLKVKDGLLEQDNFYMVSPFSDFLGVAGTHRDGNNLFIDTNEKIERLFPYENFLVMIRKENWTTLASDDRFIFYVGDSADEWGVADDWDGDQHEYMKIIVIDGFVQCYVSSDAITWENVGGTNLLGTTVGKQGFRKEGSKSLKLMDFKVYRDPYVTIQNFPENYKVELYSADGTKLKERLFDSNEEANVFIDYPLSGFIKVFSDTGTLMFTSNTMNFNYGDTFTACEFQLELEYKGVVVPEEEITSFGTFGAPQLVTLRNISTSETYSNLTISTEVETNDIIELSFDNITFTPILPIASLAPNEEVDIYVSVTRGSETPSFVTREFQFKVE